MLILRKVRKYSQVKNRIASLIILLPDNNLGRILICIFLDQYFQTHTQMPTQLNTNQNTMYLRYCSHVPYHKNISGLISIEQHYFSWMNNIPHNVPIILNNYSLNAGLLGCFQFFRIINRAAVNVLVDKCQYPLLSKC